MKIFFLGDMWLDGGPNNVNRGLSKYFDNNFIILKKRNPFLQIFEIIFKIIIADVVVISGIKRINAFALKIIKLFRKKMIYIMHGYLKIEDAIEEAENEFGEKIEQETLSCANLILCVSPFYKEWVSHHIPEIKDKLGVLTNGIDWDNLHYVIRKKDNNNQINIAVAGGSRKRKNNLVVCHAVEKLRSQTDRKIVLKIFGPIRDDNFLSEVQTISNVKICGMTNYDEFIKELGNTDLFIANSMIESFGLAPIEALCCGCSLLISKNCGVASLLKNITDEDLIHDPNDINEFCEKIDYLLSNPNNKKLYFGIDHETTSYEYRVKELKEYCREICYENKN